MHIFVGAFFVHVSYVPSFSSSLPSLLVIFSALVEFGEQKRWA